MTCLACDTRQAHDTPHAARGLCNRCYQRHLRAGTIEQFPRRLRRCVEITEEYEFLRSAGLTLHEVAARLGITERSVYRALAATRQLTGGSPMTNVPSSGDHAQTIYDDRPLRDRTAGDLGLA